MLHSSWLWGWGHGLPDGKSLLVDYMVDIQWYSCGAGGGMLALMSRMLLVQ